jgi:hypothetical protein
MVAKKNAPRKKTGREAKRTSNEVISAPSEEIKFHYLKGNSYRSIHADGFYGGVTAHNYIHMVAFSERNPIPQQAFYPVIAKQGAMAQIGDEDKTKRIGKDGIIRELEIGIFFDLSTALALQQWLDKKINELRARDPLLTSQGENT